MISICLEKKEIKKLRPIKKTWYDYLINYFPEAIRRSVGSFKNKILILFKTNTPKQTMYGRGKKLRKSKTQNIRKKKKKTLEKKKREIKDRIITDIWNFLQQKKKKKKEIREKKHNERIIKDRIIMDITTLFRQYEEDYYKPKRVHNFWSNNFIEYEKNGDKKGMLSLDQYLNKLEPYLRKFQLKVAINFISSKYNEEEHVTHSRSNNIILAFYNYANEVVDELLESLRSMYQRNLETSMTGSDFIFESVQFMYCKCHKVN